MVFLSPCTEQDGPLLSVKQISFTPEVQAGMQQEEEHQLIAEAAIARGQRV